jgi:hypothetical protein
MLISMQCVRATLFRKQLNEAKKIYTSRRDRQYHACLTLVATALVAGADLATLVKQTGYRAEFIALVSNRMRQASLWTGDQTEIDEWAESDFMLTIFAHASVASGRVGREINSNGAVGYFDLI